MWVLKSPPGGLFGGVWALRNQGRLQTRHCRASVLEGEINGKYLICSLSHLYKEGILALVLQKVKPSLTEAYLCSISAHLNICMAELRLGWTLRIKATARSLYRPHCLSGSYTLVTETEGRG